MGRLFDYDLPAERPARERARAKAKERDQELPGDAPALVWRHLLDHGADPLVLAGLLRDGLPRAERERAYFELVRAVGAQVARDAWQHAFVAGAGARRRAFPVAAREIAEAALGMPLLGIHVVTGELVDLVAARLGTPAFTIGSEVFISADGGGQAVLVHEAIHAAQQRGASPSGRPGAPGRAAEEDAHRILRRVGPLEGHGASWMSRDRARAALAVRAALGRAPRLAARPLALAAYEPTPDRAEAALAEGEKLAAALERLLARGADRAELKLALGPAGDEHAARVRQVALHKLSLSLGRAPGQDVRAQLWARLGTDAADYLQAAPDAAAKISDEKKSNGRALPDGLRAELEPRLGVPLGGVRVHDDAAAHDRAARLDAAAFTDGADVYFAAGRFDPASPDGRRLIAHELAHVAQQSGAAPSSPGARLSDPSSAAEREADLVADAVVAGAPAKVQERAAPGTVSRKEAAATPAPTSAVHKWVVTLLHQALEFDPSISTDALDGLRKLRLPRTRVGPITLREARVKLDSSGGVESGTLYASVDDGRFRGSSGALQVDKNGVVSGSLDVQVAIPQAFAKNLQLALAADGLSATVPIAIENFLAKELPVTASRMTLAVSSGASGLAATLDGDATVKLDHGFASGTGRMTAAITASGTPAIAAEVAAALQVPGLDAVADARLKWDGKTIDLQAAAKTDIKIPGLSGTAQLTYKDGRLHVKVPDLAFTWKPLGDRLKFGAFEIIDGKLKGAVSLSQQVAIELPGVQLTIGPGTNLAVDGADLTGAALGNLKIGGKTPIFDGDFKLTWQSGQVDADVLINRALLPFLKVEGLRVGVKDLGGANDWSFGGDINIEYREMKSSGKWHLPRFKGGSLLGDFHLDFDFPQLKLPSLDFSLLPDWRLGLPKLPDFKIDLDLGALLGRLGDFFGKLPRIDLNLGLRDTDLFNLGGLVDSLNFTGLKIPLPKLSFAFLEKLDLKLPGFGHGGGEGIDWSKLAGLLKLKLDLSKLKLPGIEIPDLDLGVDAGKLLGKLKVDVDISKVLKFLKGKLSFQFDTAFPDFLHIDGLGINLSDPNLARYASAALQWLQNKFSGALHFEKGEFPFKGIKVRVVGGEIKLDDLRPTGYIEVEAAGAKNKATGKLSYNENGELKIEGKFDIDAAGVTNGWLTGLLSFGNYGGSTTLGGKVDFAKGPLVNKVTGIDATYDLDKNDFDAKFHLKADSFAKIPQVTVTGFDAAIAVAKQGDGIKLDGEAAGHVKVGTYFEGDVHAGYKNGKFFGQLTTQKPGLKIKLPAGAKLVLDAFKVLLDEELRLQDGNATIGINLYDFITGDLTLHVASQALSGFDFKGKVKETRFTKAVQNVALGYRDGAWSGETAVHFKELGGVLDEGASVTVKGSAEGGVTVEAKDVVFKKGLLKGFTVNEVHYSESTFGGTLSGGKDLQIGPVKASVSPDSKVSFDKQAGLGGHVGGELQFGAAAQAQFELTGKGETVDVAVKSTLQLSSLSKALEGEIRVDYDSAKKTFSFEALNPGFTNAAVKKIAHVDWVKYDGHDFDVHISVVPGVEFSAGENRKATVLSGHVAFNHGALDGEIKGRITGTGANATVTAGWKKGEFYLGAGGEFDLSKYSGGQVTGHVQAEGSTDGGASFKLLDEIKIVKLPQIKITSLSGDLQGGNFQVGVDFDSLGKAIQIPMVKLTGLHGKGKLHYDHGDISLDGEVAGAATVSAGGKDVVKGQFALNYKEGEFGGKVTVNEVLLSKWLKSEKLAIDYEKLITKIDGAFGFAIPNIISHGTFKPNFDLKANRFDFAADLQFAPDAIKELKAHIAMKDGKLDVSVALAGNKTIKTAGAELTLGSGSHLAYDQSTDSVTGALSGSAKLGKLASGEFDLSFADKKLSGKLDLKVAKVPLFKSGTEISVKFDDGKLNTVKDIILELDEKYGQYLTAKVAMSVHDNKIKIEGDVREVKKLGKLGKQIQDGKIWYDAESEAVGARGAVDLSSLGFLSSDSKLALSIDSNLNFGVKGHLGFKPVGGAVHMTGQLDFEWAPGRFSISGGIHGDIKGLAELTLRASSSKVDQGEHAELPEGEHLKFNLAGKLTAQGLAKRFPKLQFSEPPSVSFWVEGTDGGAMDYGMDPFATRIIRLPGVDHCDIALAASYAKGTGFDASVHINDLRYKMFKFSGGMSIKESKFENASLEIESTLKAVNLKGGVKIHASEMDKLTADAELSVVPSSGSALKWLESGSAKASLKEGSLASVSGELTIRKPPLLPLEETTLKLRKEGEDIYGSLETHFAVPFSKDKKGSLKVEFGGEKHWSVYLDAEIKPPAFKSGHINGYADGDGTFKIGGSLEADNPKLIREGRLELGYKDGFYIKGGLTLKISETLDGSVDVEYDQKNDDFIFQGEIKAIQKPPEKTYKPLGGFDYELDIPLMSIGVASLNLELGAAFSMGIVMPYVQFEGLKVTGSLRQLQAGNLPEIVAKARFGMGARAHFELSIGVNGKISLLVATAKAGLRGKLTADADLNAYAEPTVTFGGNHDGVDIDLDAAVNGGIKLEASLEAFLKAKVFGFTIVDETWPLASFPIAEFRLPEWKPFDPFSFNVGGSKPGFKGGSLPSVKQTEPPGLTDGAKKSSEAADEEMKAEKAKENTRPVMVGIRDAARQFEQLPPNWQKGLQAAPVNIDDFVGCDEDAWDYYAEKAGDCETWFPELAAHTPAQRMAKAVAIIARDDKKRAGEMILGWQRAQIAHMGINPDSGVNLIQERAEIGDLQQRAYLKEKGEADAKQLAQDVAFALAVAKQNADWQAAETAHEKKIEETKRQYEQKVSQLKGEGSAAKKRVDAAKLHAKHEGVSDEHVKTASAHHDAPAAPPPGPPPVPAKLEKPAPLVPKPPVPQPLPPEPLPPVVVPREPQGPENLLPGGPTPETDAPDWKAPKAQRKDPTGAPDSQAVAASGGAVGRMAQTGQTQPTGRGKDLGGTPKSGPKTTTTPPEMIEGAGDLAKQGAVLDAELVAAGGEPKNAVRSGGVFAYVKAMIEGRRMQSQAKNAAPQNNPPPAAGGVDPTVEKVAQQGHVAEDRQAAAAQQQEQDYKNKMAERSAQAGQAEGELSREEQKARAEKAKKRMPPLAAFPLPTPEQGRTQYSNWARLKLSGETLQSFSEKLAMRRYFNFEQRAWGSVVWDYQKVLEKEYPWAPPDPRDWAEKLATGHVFDGKISFYKAAVFDPGFSLSDEAIKAHDTLERFKQVYQSCPPAVYLVREAEQLGDAARAAFVAAKVAPIAETFEPARALRAAFERLGPAAEVQRELGIVDGGKLVDAPLFWQQSLNRFNPNASGLQQINDAIHALQAAKKLDGPAVAALRPVENQAEPPRMAHFADVRARFEALRGMGALEQSLAAHGVAAAAGAAANREALLAAKRLALAALAKNKTGAKPEQIFESWLADARRRAVEHNRAAADLSLKYAALIVELRSKAPRLDQEGVTRGCALFRQRVGSNALAFGIGDVNPSGTAPGERVDAAVAYARVDGADWNPLLDKAWIEGVYQAFNAAELAGLTAKETPAAPASAPPKPSQPAAKLAAVPAPAPVNTKTDSNVNANPGEHKDPKSAAPEIPRTLVEPKPAELKRPAPALARALADAQAGQVIFQGGAGSPEQVTKNLLAHHPDARLDPASGALTLPAVDAGAVGQAESLERLGALLATETGVDRVYVQPGPEEPLDAPATLLKGDIKLPSVEKQKKQRIDVYAQINPITKVISAKLDPKTSLLAESVAVPTAAEGLLLTITPADWEHILQGHVKATFQPAARRETPRSYVFLGTPAEYADLLEQACQNAAVARDLKAKQSPIRLKFMNQEFSLKVDLATSQIKTFHATGLVANKNRFKIWNPDDPAP